jgi:hypothetical protein
MALASLTGFAFAATPVHASRADDYRDLARRIRLVEFQRLYDA